MDSRWRPSVDEKKDKLSSSQDQNEKPLHARKGLDAHVLHIKALLLVKAVPMFNASALTPVVIDGTDSGDGCQRDISKQHQGAVFGRFIGHNCPKILCCARQPETELADVKRGEAYLARMRKSHPKGVRKKSCLDHLTEGFRFPAVEAHIVDFDIALKMAGTDDKFIGL